MCACRSGYELTLRAGLRCGHTYTVADESGSSDLVAASVPQMFEWDRKGAAVSGNAQVAARRAHWIPS